jgi:hypothetical protein
MTQCEAAVTFFTTYALSACIWTQTTISAKAYWQLPISLCQFTRISSLCRSCRLLMLHLTRPSAVELGTNCAKEGIEHKMCSNFFGINFAAVYRILIDIHTAFSHNKFYYSCQYMLHVYWNACGCAAKLAHVTYTGKSNQMFCGWRKF